jgi:short subunit dehydrogenase-like uncharacterized protein
LRIGSGSTPRCVSVVLNAAGPFSATAWAMADACLSNGVHYLDITGEIDVFEALFARDAEAQRAGVTLMSGVGFDVVPSDCLAAHLKRRLPDATQLTLYFSPGFNVSRGTMKTMIENVAVGARARRNGRLVTVAKPNTGSCDFGRGLRSTVQVAWGDVSTAFHSTGSPTSLSTSRPRRLSRPPLGLRGWSGRYSRIRPRSNS